MFFEVILIIILLVLGILFLLGKLNFLIGSKKDLDNYDLKKLSKALGIFMLYLSIVVLLFGLGGVFKNQVLDILGLSLLGSGVLAFILLLFLSPYFKKK